jgi:protoheme IX farnesyltransferase
MADSGVDSGSTRCEPGVSVTAIDARAAASSRTRSLRGTAGAYLALTKPRIIELLLVTTVPTMFLAADGVPDLGVVVATVVGGALAAGSANSLNCYVDRDIDALMTRTGRRPLARSTVSPREALWLGLVLGLVSLGLLWVFTGPLATALTAFAIAFYVLGYTIGLKRRTASNIVWGGAAGCMPVLIGWAAVSHTIDWPAWVLFTVVFFWTPPHFWALALRFRDDYAAAGVPMLPVVADDAVVTDRIVRYSWLMVAASVCLIPVAGVPYAVVAIGLAAAFLAEAYALRSRSRQGQHGSTLRPMRLFHWSISYLTLLFVMVGVSPFLPHLLGG